MGTFLAHMDEKLDLLEGFEKNFENFHKNIAKNPLFLHIFQKELTNNALLFLRVWTKNANCWEILR